MSDRFGIIGASEVAGLLKEYSANLLAENIISASIHDSLLQMPSYLETRYSLARKLMLNREQFKRFSDFITNEAMKRGQAMEEAVKDDFIAKDTDVIEIDGFTHTFWCIVVESQTIKEKIIKGCKFPFRATIDYILSDGSILECKTTDISQWFKIEKYGLPFNYYIQCQAQMWLHEKESCFIHIAGVNKENGIKIFEGDIVIHIEGVNKEHQILESKTFTIKLDTQIIRAITASLVWFSAEFEKSSLLDKQDSDKTKKDKQIDAFLELERGTLEKPLESDLSAKLSRLKELEEQKREYEKLDKEIRETIRQSMTGYKYARFKSNQFEIEAKYSNESYHDEESINEAVEKAKSIQVGDVKASKKLTIKY